MEDLGKGEHHEGAGGDQRRMQALRQIEAVERQHDRPAADETDDGAADRLDRELFEDGAPGLAALQPHADQGDGEENREGIVGR